MLADVASSGDQRNLVKLGLDRQSPKSQRPRWTDYLLVGAVILGILAGVVSGAINFLPRLVPQLTAAPRLEQNTAIARAVQLYDLGYQQALRTQDTTAAQAIMSPELYQDFLRMLNRYSNEGCIIETYELSPAEITSIEQLSPQQVKVQVKKSWQQLLFCPQKEPFTLSNGPFEVEYQIAKGTNGWIVVDSSRL